MTPVMLPARVRGILYLAYGILGVALGAIQVGYSAAEQGQPTWLTVTLAVYAFVGAGFGLTAASNTPTSDDVPRHLVE